MLEPVIVNSLKAFTGDQVMLILFSSFRTQSTEKFQEALAFTAGVRADQISFKNLIGCFKLFTSKGWGIDSLKPSIGKLMQGLIQQSIPNLSKRLGRAETITTDDLLTIMEYILIFSSKGVLKFDHTFLEILSLQFIRLRSEMKTEDFLKIYFYFAEVDLHSLAMADHFNKTFLDVVMKDQAESGAVAKLEGPQKGKFDYQEPKPSQQSAQEANWQQSFLRTINYTWSFFKFSYRSGDTKHIDKKLLEQMLDTLNKKVSKYFLILQMKRIPREAKLFLSDQSKERLFQINGMSEFLLLNKDKRLNFQTLRSLSIGWQDTSEHKLDNQFKAAVEKLRSRLEPLLIEDTNLPSSLILSYEDVEMAGVVISYKESEVAWVLTSKKLYELSADIMRGLKIPVTLISVRSYEEEQKKKTTPSKDKDTDAITEDLKKRIEDEYEIVIQ